MAQIKFEDIQEMSYGGSENQNRVGFFSLKNDGDEAIVRIMHDSTDSFEIVSTHQIKINVNGKDRWRRINCCRTPYEPIENCPICATGENAQSRFYVHIIEYTSNNGEIVAEPKVWERPASFATTLKNLIVNYGPLSNSIFKIHRNGVARAMDTTYDLMYMPPQQYPENVYKKIVGAFDNYSVIGTVVMDKTPADIVTFLQTGDFPVPNKNNQSAPTNSTNTAYYPPQSGYVDNSHTTTSTAVPNVQPTMDRPTRYY